MKKIVILICLFAFGMSAQAQTYIYPSAQDFAGWLTAGTASGDTLTNSATETFIVALKGSKTSVCWQVSAVKISGTLGGYIQCFGSANDTTYITTPFHVDTMSNATANYGYTFNYNPYAKVRIVVTQTGTTKAAYRLGAIWRYH